MCMCMCVCVGGGGGDVKEYISWKLSSRPIKKLMFDGCCCQGNKDICRQR